MLIILENLAVKKTAKEQKSKGMGVHSTQVQPNTRVNCGGDINFAVCFVLFLQRIGFLKRYRSLQRKVGTADLLDF